MSTLRLVLRKPLLLLFCTGCLVSASVSGRYSPRLICDGAISFAFLPMVEIVALAVVRRTGRRRPLPFATSVDLFFAGNLPWLLWLACVAAVLSVAPTRHTPVWPLVGSAIVPVLWSIYLDFHFFQVIMGRSRIGATIDLLLLRVIAWSASVAYFFGIAIWGAIIPRVQAWLIR